MFSSASRVMWINLPAISVWPYRLVKLVKPVRLLRRVALGHQRHVAVLNEPILRPNSWSLRVGGGLSPGSEIAHSLRLFLLSLVFRFPDL